MRLPFSVFGTSIMNVFFKSCKSNTSLMSFPYLVLFSTMGSSVANQNQTKKIAETGTSQCSYIVMKGAKIFHGHY